MTQQTSIRCAECGAVLRATDLACWLCQTPYLAPPHTLIPQQSARPSETGLEAYSAGLRHLLRDGTLDMGELQQLAAVVAKYGLGDEHTRPLRAQAFERQYGLRLADGFLSDQELQELKELLANLSLTPADVPEAMQAMQRIYYLQQIRQGNIPSLPVGMSTLNPRTNETVHLETPVSMRKMKTVSKGWQSGNTGLSFRIAKGVYWRVGGTRGHMLTEQQLVTESTGTLCITNQRLAYLANTKAFSFDWSKIMGLEPYNDALTVFVQGRANSPTVFYEDTAQSELVAAVCSHYVNL